MQTNYAKNEIKKGEKILWQGNPDYNILLNSADGLIVPFTIIWLSSFIAFEMYSMFKYVTVKDNMQLFNFIFGIPFIIVGIYFTAGRFLLKRIVRKNTIYLITNWRIITITNVFNMKIESIYLPDLVSIVKVNKKKMSGNIIFCNDAYFSKIIDNPRFRDRYVDFRDSFCLLPIKIGYELTTFFDISDIDRVYAIIQNAQKGFKRKKFILPKH